MARRGPRCAARLGSRTSVEEGIDPGLHLGNRARSRAARHRVIRPFSSSSTHSKTARKRSFSSQVLVVERPAGHPGAADDLLGRGCRRIPSSVKSSRATRMRVPRVLSDCCALRLIQRMHRSTPGATRASRPPSAESLDMHTACMDNTCSLYVKRPLHPGGEHHAVDHHPPRRVACHRDLPDRGRPGPGREAEEGAARPFDIDPGVQEHEQRPPPAGRSRAVLVKLRRRARTSRVRSEVAVGLEPRCVALGPEGAARRT